MEVAVSRCGSTIPIEFTHGLRRFAAKTPILAAGRRFRSSLLMHFAVSRREVAESRRRSTIPIEFTNALRRFSPRIVEFLMEVARFE